MDQNQMKERCPDSELVGKVVLKNYKLAFTIYSHKRECGCADIVASQKDEVWGLLYELSDSDLVRLDIAEAHPDKYRRFRVHVENESGKVVEAESYEVVNKEFNIHVPSRDYIGKLIHAASDFNFPKGYQEMLLHTPTSDNVKKCPICGDVYTQKDPKVDYHVQYLPSEVTTDACSGCNYAEFLLRNPEQINKIDPKEKYHMKHRMDLVRKWTLKNKPLVG